MLLPLMALAAFVLIFITNRIISNETSKLIDDIEKGYEPMLRQSSELENTLAQIQRQLQDAVAAADQGSINEAENLSRQFIALADEAVKNRIADKNSLLMIKTEFEEYFKLAVETSRRIVNGEVGEQITASMESMISKYNSIRDKLQSNTKQNRENMAAAFGTVRKSQRTALNLIGGATLVCLILMIILSAWIIRGVINPFNQCLDFARKVGDGDLTGKLEINTRDETRDLGEALNSMIRGMQQIIGRIMETNSEIQRSITEIQTSIVQQTRGVEYQATAVSQISATINEIRVTSKQTASFAQRVLEDSDRSVQVSREGITTNKRSVDGMNQINDQMGTIAETILSFSERSQQIVDIIATVNDLAQQSNFLALNASIEAAKAGEHGKGFAVVAMEVRNLAEQSQEATAQIRQILNEIQTAINSSVLVTENGTKKVEEGVKLIQTMGEVITQLSDVVNEGATGAKQISASVGQQSVGIDQIAQGMNEINRTMNEASINAKQVEQTVKSLSVVGDRLTEAINKYRII